MLYDNIILLLSTVLMLYCFQFVEVKSGTKKKRIVYGHAGLLNHRDNYPSFRYYVFLAKGEILEQTVEEPDFISSALGLTSPNSWHLECGGILLTPSIVQTACHCIGNFYTQNAGDNVSFSWPLNVWEDRYYSYIGSNLISRMFDLLRPKHYVVYQACRKFNRGSYQLFDYGLIITKDSVDKRAPSAKISYAPVYHHPEIVDFFNQATQKEFMCLLIGHAFWQIEYDGDGKPQFVVENSEYIRWGWRTIMNNIDCLTVSYTPEEREEFEFDYIKDATWVCAQAFKPSDFRYLNVPGDSGGPITCNDVYFSIMSMTTELYVEDIISYSSPIVLTHFENAAEYRDNFIIWCEEYEEGDRPIIEPDDIEPTRNPELRSRCRRQELVHILFMFVPTAVFYIK